MPAGNALYIEEFLLDTAGLAAGFGLHFDLYNIETKLWQSQTDIVVNKFAPFSHDAEMIPVPPQPPNTGVPEPMTPLLMLSGMDARAPRPA